MKDPWLTVGSLLNIHWKSARNRSRFFGIKYLISGALVSGLIVNRMKNPGIACLSNIDWRFLYDFLFNIDNPWKLGHNSLSPSFQNLLSSLREREHLLRLLPVRIH